MTIARMQNKSAALSNRCCGGTSSFRLTKLWSWRHKKVMVCVFFEVFSKQLYYIYRQMSDCRACWICGRSVLGVRIYEAVPELCRPVDIWHGSRTLRYGLWRSWGRSASSKGWGDSFKVFFLSFSCLPMHLSVSASSFLIDAGSSARPASGNWAHSWCCLSEGKQFIRDLQNEMPSGVLQTTKLFYANFQFTSTASWSWKVKKNSNAKIKKKKRNVEVLLQLRKKLIMIVHGCRYSVASEKWADYSTVLISMRAVIESAKFEKKKVEKRYNAARQKGKKKWKNKCYHSSKANP